MIRKITLIAIGTLLLTAGMAEARPATFADLDGHSYESTAIRGSKARPKQVELFFTEGQDIWKEPFDPESSVPILGAYSGCNSMSARYRVEGGVVRWTSRRFSSLVGCMPDRDGWISRHLTKGMRAEIKGTWLILSRGTAVRIWLRQKPDSSHRSATFDGRTPHPGPTTRSVRVPATIRRLSGHDFRSISIKGPRTRPDQIELSFFRDIADIDGPPDQETVPWIGMYAGCNHMAAEYRMRKGHIRLVASTFESTAMACSDDRSSWITRPLDSGMKAYLVGRRLVVERGRTRVVFRQVR